MADHRVDTFTQVIQAATRQGMTAHLPRLAAAGVQGLQSLADLTPELLHQGSRPAAPTATTEALPRGRPDLPTRRYTPRASLQQALKAARPNSRKRALEALDDGVLAASTRGPMESRRRTWEELCLAWQTQPWPITADNVRMAAASLKAGGYQSAQLYFDAAVWYQSHVRQEPVPPHIRKLVNSYLRSITRGVPAAKLKQAFPLEQLEAVVDLSTAHQPYDPTNPHHAADALIVCTWFMLRGEGNRGRPQPGPGGRPPRPAADGPPDHPAA